MGNLEEKVLVLLPGDKGEGYVEGAVNGVNFRIPTGRAVEIPAHILRVLEQSRQELLQGERRTEVYASRDGKKLG